MKYVAMVASVIIFGFFMMVSAELHANVLVMQAKPKPPPRYKIMNTIYGELMYYPYEDDYYITRVE